MNKYANIGSRFLALLIDGIILSVINAIMFYLFLVISGDYAALRMLAKYGDITAPGMLRLLDMLDFLPIYSLCSVLLTIFYYALFESSVKGATLGKMLLGIKVVDASDRRITFGTAIARSLSRILSSFLYIGYIIALVDASNQSLHDKIAGTYVISSKYSYTEMAIRNPKPATENTGYVPVQPVRPMVAPKLIAVSGQLAGMSFPVDSRGVMIGRDPSCCGIIFHKDTLGISRHHCTVSYNDQTGMFILNDCGSTYGTFVANGMKVANGQPVALNNGERFYLGSPANSFELRIS